MEIYVSKHTYMFLNIHTHTLGRGNPFYCIYWISSENCRAVWSGAYRWADVMLWLRRPVSGLITSVSPTFNLI